MLQVVGCGRRRAGRGLDDWVEMKSEKSLSHVNPIPWLHPLWTALKK